jgi:ribosome maturation factor RimP
VEIDSDSSLSIDDCSELSQFIEKKLDRDVEDYELEVGSAGITSPFRVLRQYQKNIGNEVEVMLKEGGKSTGILSRADENGFELTVKKQVKPEGAKKKITVEENIPFTYDKIRYIKNVIRFK